MLSRRRISLETVSGWAERSKVGRQVQKKSRWSGRYSTQESLRAALRQKLMIRPEGAAKGKRWDWWAEMGDRHRMATPWI